MPHYGGYDWMDEEPLEPDPLAVTPPAPDRLCCWRCGGVHDPASHIAGGFTPLGESDPNGIEQHTPGAKLDAGKPQIRRGLLEQFPRACAAVAAVTVYGAQKYTWGGWEHVPDGVSRYSEAELRHVCDRAVDGEHDPKTGLLHRAQEAWNALAALELFLREQETIPVGAAQAQAQSGRGQGQGQVRVMWGDPVEGER